MSKITFHTLLSYEEEITEVDGGYYSKDDVPHLERALLEKSLNALTEAQGKGIGKRIKIAKKWITIEND